MKPRFKIVFNKWKKRVILFSAILAGIAAVLSNGETILKYITNLNAEKKGIKIVEIFPKGSNIDLKLRNNGDEVAVLKKMELNIKRKWIISPWDILFGLLESSATYQFLIDIEKSAPYIISKRISHELKPNESDRITVDIGTVQNHFIESYIYMANIVICYNETGDTLVSDDFIFGFITREDVTYLGKDILQVPDTLSGENKRIYDMAINTYSENKRQIEEIKRINAIKSEDVQDFILEISNK